MPFKKKTTRTRRRRTTRVPRGIPGRSSTSRYITTSDVRNGIGIPAKKYVKLHYSDSNVMATGDQWKIKINDILDPDAAIGGHQPLGFDQWSTYYGRYTVLGAKYKFRMQWEENPSASTPMQFAVVLDRDGTATNTMSYLAERNHGGGNVVLPANSNSTRELSGTYNTKKFFGITDIMDNHSVGSDIASSPSWLAYLILSAKSANITGLGVDCVVLVDIEFSVVWTEPRDIAQS